MLALLPGWLDPQTIIENGGLWLVAAIVFAESGLLFGFFLPGDSLLFITGFLASKPEGLPHIDQPLPVVLLVLFVAAVLGDQVGYIFGRSVGPSLFHRPKSRLFNPANVDKAHAFFEQHGPKTIVLARFVPIVRTFAPIVAGVGEMKYRTFLTYNVVGAAALGGRRHDARLLPRPGRLGPRERRDRGAPDRGGVVDPDRVRGRQASPPRRRRGQRHADRAGRLKRQRTT